MAEASLHCDDSAATRMRGRGGLVHSNQKSLTTSTAIQHRSIAATTAGAACVALHQSGCFVAWRPNGPIQKLSLRALHSAQQPTVSAASTAHRDVVAKPCGARWPTCLLSTALLAGGSMRWKRTSALTRSRRSAVQSKSAAVSTTDITAGEEVETSVEPMLVADIEKSLPSTNFLLIGNPGVGKSTLLNGLIAGLFGGEDLYFPSGISIGSGLTYQFDIKQVGRHCFMDTPGLSDIQKRQQAADAITQALRRGGHYKIAFVVTLENGRVRADDLATMKLVLDAAPITNYGILVNQVQPKVLDRLLGRNGFKEQAAGQLKEILVHLMGTMEGRATPSIHAVPRDMDLDGEDNVVKAVDDGTLEFLCGLQGMEIKPEAVVRVRGEDFDSVKERVAKSMEELSKQVALGGGLAVGLGALLVEFLEAEALATFLVGGSALTALGCIGIVCAPLIAEAVVENRRKREENEGTDGKQRPSGVVDVDASSELATKEQVEAFLATELKINLDSTSADGTASASLEDLGTDAAELAQALRERFKVRVESAAINVLKPLRDTVQDIMEILKKEGA
mmetsp:Transcript_41957/g.96297  ORF Transcript_41957/g.96297 Transcript_41957/m.96297 type:complete len:565 (-) Transcript_41957:63-1757(-)